MTEPTSGGAPEASHAKGPRHRILVVDDNEDARDLMRALLEKMGHEVRTAGDGPRAVEEARRFCPALVLLDIGLPHMDGYAVARQIRAEHGSKIVMAALTGYGQEKDRKLSREAGIDHHLVKPVGLDAVRKIISQLA